VRGSLVDMSRSGIFNGGNLVTLIFLDWIFDSTGLTFTGACRTVPTDLFMYSARFFVINTAATPVMRRSAGIPRPSVSPIIKPTLFVDELSNGLLVDGGEMTASVV
jgi:hypothetical protein